MEKRQSLSNHASKIFFLGKYSNIHEGRGNHLNEWRPDEWREYKDKSMQRFNRIRCDRLPYFFTHILTWWAIIRFHLTSCLSTHYIQKKILLSMSFVKEMILTGDQIVVKTEIYVLVLVPTVSTFVKCLTSHSQPYFPSWVWN